MKKTVAECFFDELYWSELENNEGITKDDAEMVMLDIAYSPVIPFKGAESCEAIPTIGGKYIVKHPMVTSPVSEEQLKVMRFRYLEFDPGRVAQREHINNLFKKP